MKKDHLLYLDGLRTIFCIVVVLHHFVMAFYPQIPSVFIFDGSYAVCFFLMLSSYLLTHKLLHKSTQPNMNILSESVIFYLKRYIRLLPIIFCAIIIGWLIQYFNGYYTLVCASKYGLDKLGTYYSEYYSLPYALYEAFLRAFFARPVLDPPLWTIRYEFLFLGVLNTLLLCACKFNVRKEWSVLIGGVIIGLTRDSYVVCMVLGIMLSIHGNKRCAGRASTIVGVSLIVSILSYGLGVCFKIGVIAKVISCFFLFYAVIYSPLLQKMLSSKVLLSLSPYSFEIYAIHWPIICSVGCYIMMQYDGVYQWPIAIWALIATIVVTSFFSIVLKRIENYFIKLMNCTVGKQKWNNY